MRITRQDVDALEREAAAHLPAVAAETYVDVPGPDWFLGLLRRAEETLRRARTWTARRAA